MAFEFLTTQQGFAANVLGNLLPLGSTAGAVGAAAGEATINAGFGTGGGTPKLPGIDPLTGRPVRESGGAAPKDVLDEQARISAAGGTGGFSSAQAATLIALTQKVVLLLSHIDDKSKHPESRRSRQTNNAALDVHK
jgi:hypothetical protein